MAASDDGGATSDSGASGSGGSGDDAATTTRDPAKWPFRADSIWNLALHRDAVLSPAGIDRMGTWYADEDVLILTPDAPLTDVLVNAKDWTTPTAGARCEIEGGSLGAVPIPRDLLIPHEQGTPNQSAAILMQDGLTVFRRNPFTAVQRPAQPRHTTYCPATILFKAMEDWALTGGSRLSSIGGTKDWVSWSRAGAFDTP
jgi:hypothetical protein